MRVNPLNVFTPAQEIQDIDRFAGRQEELQGLANALQSQGTQIVLYGQRGVGKSSLARQLLKLSTHEEEIVSRLDPEPYETLDFLPVYVSCDDSVEKVEDVLLRLLSDEEALASWVPFKVVEKSGSQSVSGRLNIKVVQLGGDQKDTMTERAQHFEDDVVTVFSNACKDITRTGVAKDGLLIVVDEFDRVGDRAGLASLLKTLGPEGVTFALVGVATTVQELITEHESVARQLTGGTIQVEPMNAAELDEIFDRAESIMEKEYTFLKEAREWIIEIARGHPFYVHLVGKHALLEAIRKDNKEIDLQTAQDALSEIALKGSAPIQEHTYKKAIGHSYTRESILKSFAERREDEIHTTELYASLSKTLGIEPSAVSVYVGQLASETYGNVLQKTRDRYYRFADSLFKAYAAARPFERTPSDQENA
ncbi:MAG: ATP-binding protein [Gammaproteobacteria bacterium]|nr:ATP-binding protein [Gammaproteobacteria bacterium]